MRAAPATETRPSRRRRRLARLASLSGLAVAAALGAAGPAHADKALIVGIDTYKDPSLSFQLQGASFADSERMHKLLVGSLGFKESDILILRDQKATRAAILGGLTSWLGQTKPGERAFFYYVGHGHFQKDLNGDEADGVDETLVPYDAVVRRGNGTVAVDNMVIDDEIGAAFDKLKGRTVTAVVDSCHSGTVTRALSAGGINLAARTPQFEALTRSITANPEIGRTKKPVKAPKDGVTAGSDVITWTAVSETQLALIDEDDAPHFHGLFTAAFADGIEKGLADANHNGVISNQELLDYVRERSADYCKRHPSRCEMGITPSLDGPNAPLRVAALNPTIVAPAGDQAIALAAAQAAAQPVEPAPAPSPVKPAPTKTTPVKPAPGKTAGTKPGTGKGKPAKTVVAQQGAGAKIGTDANEATKAIEVEPVQPGPPAQATAAPTPDPVGPDAQAIAAAQEAAQAQVPVAPPPPGPDAPPATDDGGAAAALSAIDQPLAPTPDAPIPPVIPPPDPAVLAAVQGVKPGDAINTGKVTPEKVLDILGASKSDLIHVEQFPPSPVKLGATNIHFRVTAPTDGYLVLLMISDEGEVVQLFPNAISDARAKDGRVKAGSPITVPDASYGISFDATSVTKGTVLALVAVDPLKLSRAFTTRKIDVIPQDEVNATVLPELAQTLAAPVSVDPVQENVKPVGRSVATLRYEITP